jgi:membrane protease YdiL (CAAX protease family)
VRWHPFDLLLILAPLIALRVVPLVGGEGWNLGLPRSAAYTAFFGSLFWMLLMPVAVARWRTGRFPGLPRLRIAVIDGALAIPLLPALWLILIVGLIAWTMIFGQPEAEQNFVDPIARSRDWLTFAVLSVFVVVIGPMSEELIFRDMMYNWLRRLPILNCPSRLRVQPLGKFSRGQTIFRPNGEVWLHQTSCALDRNCASSTEMRDAQSSLGFAPA